MKRLYLEERIAIVRKALNEETLQYSSKMRPKDAEKFNAFVNALLHILDGFELVQDADTHLEPDELEP
jgi:hypothetical protein